MSSLSISASIQTAIADTDISSGLTIAFRDTFNCFRRKLPVLKFLAAKPAALPLILVVRNPCNRHLWTTRFEPHDVSRLEAAQLLNCHSDGKYIEIVCPASS